MARKKRRGGHSRRPRPTPPPAALPDLRALERMMHQFVAPGDDTPLSRAQELMYQAFAEPDDRRRADLARQALTLCPDCADAYVLLAEQTPSRKEALALYEQGVAAGARALGEQAFREATGHFWGVLPTRPYMRARLGLAHSLWTAGRHQEAVQHAQEMLRLNPNDNQGVRNTLAGWLLALDHDEELTRLLDRYPEEGTAAWAYTRALLAFRRQGDTPEARRLLQEARERNPHVGAYLLGEKHPPPQAPDYYSHGEESEALVFLGSFLPGWRFTPGAIAWLRQVEKEHRPKPETPQPRGPLGFVKSWLRQRLPQEQDVWQADCRPLPNRVVLAGAKVRPWLTLVSSRSNDLVLAHGLHLEPPGAKHLWDTLVQAMQEPAAGEPHRPTELQVRAAAEHWESLRPHLEEVGVRLVLADELDQMDFLFPDVSAHVAGKPLPGLLDVPGVTPEQVAGFYEAAASYFAQAPWRKVGYEAALEVKCDRFHSGPWYAVIMGQSGLTLGLALYDDLDALRRIWSQESADEENARQTVGLSVTFGEETDIPVADLDAAQRYGWQVARSDAYPAVFRKERGRSMRPPLAWELELLAGCLRAVPGFVSRHPQDDPTPEEQAVPVASGEMKLSLSWVVDLGE
jgi:tetratricopeptide (TPR) repeat protein